MRTWTELRQARADLELDRALDWHAGQRGCAQATVWWHAARLPKGEAVEHKPSPSQTAQVAA